MHSIVWEQSLRSRAGWRIMTSQQQEVVCVWQRVTGLQQLHRHGVGVDVKVTCESTLCRGVFSALGNSSKQCWLRHAQPPCANIQSTQ